MASVAQSKQTHVDIVGDVHGCCGALIKLLERLGYQLVDGAYQHEERQAVFVGDLLDRGPEIRETVSLVKSMCERGSAAMVLGNHEYNALLFEPQISRWLLGEDENLELPERLRVLMAETLGQYRDYPDLWFECCRWLESLPLFLDRGSFRVVHACWDHSMIEQYRQSYPEQGINAAFVEASKAKGSFEARIADRLTRGTSMPLPDGMQVHSKDGFIRRFFRTKFWEASPKTYGDIVFQPDPLPYDFAEHPIQQDHKDNLLSYATDETPVFFGHYWLSGKPKPLQKNIACLDYSAVNFGRLTAYQFDGERQLSRDKFRWVYVDREAAKKSQDKGRSQ